jgi:hypothetical protein
MKSNKTSFEEIQANAKESNHSEKTKKDSVTAEMAPNDIPKLAYGVNFGSTQLGTFVSQEEAKQNKNDAAKNPLLSGSMFKANPFN